MYLTVLADLERVRCYSWGSSCLATLYREMCRATDPDAKTMGDCAPLLQSWAWYSIPFIAARVIRTLSYPLVTRWSGGGLSFTDTPNGDLIGYRMRLDHMTTEQITFHHTHTNSPPMTDYVFPITLNMDYTPPIVQPDDFLSNVFGTNYGIAASAPEYMHSL
ncbi:Serine/threonine-protein phosphatase 7 long form [Glycine max]|nr:Serine/threonine-protein phosphatase 7 long form [Glycine max]